MAEWDDMTPEELELRLLLPYMIGALLGCAAWLVIGIILELGK